jgi:hypothetical protein
MKRIAVAVGLGIFLALPGWLATAQEPHSASGQNHGEIGVFADYLRFAPARTTDNFVGVGARVDFNFHPNVGLEAEMSYDFARNYTTINTSGTGASGSTNFVTTNVRPLTGLFGPKFQFGTGAFRAFLTGKVGFIDFSTNNSGTVTGSTFSNAITGIGGSGTHVAFYPGGGLEGFMGPIGLRLDVGDEVYLNSGVYNNLRVTFGPEIRF